MKLAAVALVVCLLGSLPILALGLVIQVEPKTSECFYQKITASSKVAFEYRVTRGGLLDINIKVTAPSGRVLHQELHFFRGDDEGVTKFDAEEDGVYSFCFDNEMSRWTAKVVDFDVISSDKTAEDILSGDLKPLERSLRSMQTELEKITKEQKYLRAREQAHRDTQESTFVRLYWFSILEYVVLLSLSVFQIYFMRKWFDSSRGGRV